MQVRAKARYLPIPPRKMRLITDSVKGKKVDDALAILRYMPSPSAKLVAKAIRSAAANAENNFQMSPDDLRIVNIFTDEGPTLKRYRARAHGRVSPILKRSSHVTVIVEEEE